MPHHSPIIAWILISVSLFLGVIVCFWVLNFLKEKNQKERFLQIRKPMVIALYCICGSIPALIIMTPLEIYADMATNDNKQINFRFNWLMVFCHEFLFASMLTVIAARCWLLYYDHSYGLSIVNQNWRGIIDPDDTDFWLKHRKTWGDFGFLVCFGVIVTSAVLILLSTASIWVFKTGNVDILPFISLFMIAIPCCIFISILIFTGKLGNLNVIYDEFSIIKEMKYLSICTWLIVILYIVQIIDVDGSFYALEAAEVLFSFITSYIQCNWVLYVMRSKQRKLFLNRYRTASVFRSEKGNSVSPRSATPYSDTDMHHLSMADVLRNKEGFGMFMRQCQNEMCVEGLLFIVEVAQYKSKTQEYEKNKRAHRGQSQGSKSSKELSDRTRSSSQSTTHSASSTIDPDAQALPPLNRVVTQKLEKDDRRFEQFRGNILSREWLPISHQLNDPRNEGNKHDNIVHFKPSTLLQPIDFAMKKEPHVTPPPIDHQVEEKEICRSTSPSPDAVETIEFLYNYAKYLFLKYIDVDSDFAVNVSHHVRKQLLLFFSSDPTPKHYRKLSHVFDPSVAETWNLLANDTFVRFKSTESYGKLLKRK